jgi:hypothetical protein
MCDMTIRTNLLGRKPTMHRDNMNTIALAEYLIMMDDTATVLCHKHTQAFEDINTAMNRPYEVYSIGDDEDPVSCQACHLAAVKANLTHH